MRQPLTHVNQYNSQYQEIKWTTTISTHNTINLKNCNQDDIEGDNYVFGKATALIFVLDAQDEPYDQLLSRRDSQLVRLEVMILQMLTVH